MSRKLESSKLTKQNIVSRLEKSNPQFRLNTTEQQLQNLVNRLKNSQSKQLEHAEKQLAVLAAKLDATSPLAVLARGYSVTQKNGKVVNSTSQVSPDDAIITKLSDGEVLSKVIEVSSLHAK